MSHKPQAWMIPVSSLVRGENRLEYSLGLDELGVEEHEVAENPSFEALEGLVDVTLSISRTGRQLLIRGEVRFHALLLCAICGVEFGRYYREPIATQLVALEGLAESEKPGFEPDEPERTALHGDMLDLRSAVRDAMHLAIPIAPRCREDCQGICPDCGANLNERRCGCLHPDSGKERTPFAELERLTRTGGPGPDS
ncbi:MAG: DUF177 domain-containing protein [candidate division WOR-3 bacterium]|nr:MAG: DUF177 domain-containing protein [candidate division WOR-3 bacterium]